MTLLVQVITSHPYLMSGLLRALSSDGLIRSRLSKVCWTDPRSPTELGQPCVFAIDSCTIAEDLGKLCRRLRTKCPGSKFVVLTPPDKMNDQELLRLLYIGVDGAVSLGNSLDEELPRALRKIFEGGVWFPSHLVMAYVRYVNETLDLQLVSEGVLTARESQVLGMVVRQMPNREIASALEISERTVKFHVSNILSKLQSRNRDSLLAKIGIRAPSTLLMTACEGGSLVRRT